MRDLVKKYSFVEGTRQITVDDARLFTAHDVRLIVNETQEVVICSSMQKKNITVVGSVITYSDALPVLSEDDQITIEIDFSKQVIKPDNINIVLNNTTHYQQAMHNAWEVIAENYNAEYPTMVLWLYSSSLDEINAIGADRYKFSDGRETEIAGTYPVAIDDNYFTKWVIYYYRGRDVSFSVSDANTGQHPIGVFGHNVKLNTVNFTNAITAFFEMDDASEFPSGALNNLQFKGSLICQICFKINKDTVTYSDSQTSTFENCLSLTNVVYPHSNSLMDLSVAHSLNAFRECSSLKSINISSMPNVKILNFGMGGSSFYNCSKLSKINIGYMPKLETLNFINTSYPLQGCINLKEISFPSPLKDGDFNLNGNKLIGLTSLAKIVIGNGWTIAMGETSTRLFNLNIALNVHVGCLFRSQWSRSDIRQNWIDYVFKRLKNRVASGESGVVRTITLPIEMQTGLTQEEKDIIINRGWTIAYGA